MNETPKIEQPAVAETEVVVDEAELSDEVLEGVVGARDIILGCNPTPYTP